MPIKKFKDANKKNSRMPIKKIQGSSSTCSKNSVFQVQFKYTKKFQYNSRNSRNSSTGGHPALCQTTIFFQNWTPIFIPIPKTKPLKNQKNLMNGCWEKALATGQMD